MEQWSQSLAVKSEFATLPLNYMYMALVLGKSMTLLIFNFNSESEVKSADDRLCCIRFSPKEEPSIFADLLV